MDDASPSDSPPVNPSDQRSAPPTAPTGAVYKLRRSWPTVVGVLGLVFAFLSILSAASSLLSVALPGMNPSAPPDDASRMMSVIVSIMSLVLAGLAIAGSILLIVRRSSSARMLRVWAVLKVVVVLASACVVYLIMREAMAQQMAGPGAQAAGPGAGFMLQSMPLLSAIFTIAFGLPWPVFMLIWMGMPSVRADVHDWSISQTKGGA